MGKDATAELNLITFSAIPHHLLGSINDDHMVHLRQVPPVLDQLHKDSPMVLREHP